MFLFCVSSSSPRNRIGPGRAGPGLIFLARALESPCQVYIDKGGAGAGGRAVRLTVTQRCVDARLWFPWQRRRHHLCRSATPAHLMRRPLLQRWLSRAARRHLPWDLDYQARCWLGDGRSLNHITHNITQSSQINSDSTCARDVRLSPQFITVTDTAASPRTLCGNVI